MGSVLFKKRKSIKLHLSIYKNYLEKALGRVFAKALVKALE